MQFDLVTPEKLVVSRKASHVIVPGTEGSFGAMAGHQPLISTLKPGALNVTTDDGDVVYYVGFGFVDVTGEKVTVLAEEAVQADQLVRADVEKEHSAVDHELKQLKKTHADEVKLSALVKKEACLRAKLDLAS